MANSDENNSSALAQSLNQDFNKHFSITLLKRKLHGSIINKLFMINQPNEEKQKFSPKKNHEELKLL